MLPEKRMLSLLRLAAFRGSPSSTVSPAPRTLSKKSRAARAAASASPPGKVWKAL